MLLGLTCLPLWACSSSETGTEAERNKVVVLRVHDELWSEGSFGALEELIAPDFLGHGPIGADWQGRDGLRERIEAHRTTFPDWSERVDEVVAEADLVAVRFTSTGTDRGGFRGNPATGREVTVREFAIYRLASGRVVEQWVLPDLLALQQQLGLIPEPAAP